MGLQQLCQNKAWQKYAQLKKNAESGEIGKVGKVGKVGKIVNSMIRFNHQAN